MCVALVLLCSRLHRRGYFHRLHADGTPWSGRRIRSSPSCHIYHQTGFNSCTDIHVKTTSLVAVCALWKEKKVVVARVRVTVFHNFSWLYSSVQKNCIDSVGVLRAIPGGRKILSVPILQYTKFCQLFIYAIGFFCAGFNCSLHTKTWNKVFFKNCNSTVGPLYEHVMT